jgi:A/G-specific adenine glycosylase
MTPVLTDEDPAAFRRQLRRWYAAHGRHTLPWRLTRDPYAVLVSEVMLQQTQVDRVLPFYEAWMARWPSASSLAASSPADVIGAWSGLGYNRRAVHLHRAATAVVARHGGQVPIEVAPLRDLPGVGPYTANAVASFAGARLAAVVDTNIGRVLARRSLGVATVRDTLPATLLGLAERLLPRRGEQARDHNLALMDLGAAVCTARAPSCSACALAANCRWRAAGSPPAPSPAHAMPRFETTARFARGRIVEALRGGVGLSEAQLARVLPASHAARLPAYLRDLRRDGLIEPCSTGWRLPVQGSTSIASPKL